MDLIYADHNRIEQGVIGDCTYDCAYGFDTNENTFECTVDLSNHVCAENDYIYFAQTEYGGIVDSISVSTESHTVSYMGRTWHGILNSRILCPAAGQDYLVLTGEANEVVGEILERTGLTDLFVASVEDSGLYISGFQVRYEYAYLAILNMLATVNGKLMFRHDDGIVTLTVQNISDYSNNEEFDSTQVGFSVQKTYNVANHFVCLGSGNLKDRNVIHLFTDEYGALQPYATTDMPLKDSDYILDESMKKIGGNDEIMYLYDYPNAQITENYVVLNVPPDDWRNTYYNYYSYDSENENYKQLERKYGDVYDLTRCQPVDWISDYKEFYYKKGDEFKPISDIITGKEYQVLSDMPSDWRTSYNSYFELKNGEYKTVSLISTDTYFPMAKEPNDWKSNYADYFYYYTDGVEEEYKKIEPAKKTSYVLQVRKPSDWDENYNAYYQLGSNGKYEAVSVKKYIAVAQKPADWSRSYANYFYYYSDGTSKGYKQISGSSKTIYTVQTSKPSDWSKNFSEYYSRVGGKYETVEGITAEKYTVQKIPPSDWRTKFSNYYYLYSDGVEKEYRKVSGESVDKYTLQTSKPSDWEEKYGNYYVYDGTDNKYAEVKGIPLSDSSDKKIAPTWKRDSYYTKSTSQVAPAWKSDQYYTDRSTTTAPTWKSGQYYTKSTTTTAPNFNSYNKVYKKGMTPAWKKKKYYTKDEIEAVPKFAGYSSVYKKVTTSEVPVWKAGTFYDEYDVNNLVWAQGEYYRLLKNQELIPEFTAGQYFQQHIDHYADLVANAINRISEVYDCDSIDIALSLEEIYDIGDVVGAVETVTGVSVWQPITKKIVTIKGKETKIDYEIGGQK